MFRRDAVRLEGYTDNPFLIVLARCTGATVMAITIPLAPSQTPALVITRGQQIVWVVGHFQLKLFHIGAKVRVVQDMFDDAKAVVHEFSINPIDKRKVATAID